MALAGLIPNFAFAYGALSADALFARVQVAKFFKLHPGYLVDDPEGYHSELLSDLRTTEDTVGKANAARAIAATHQTAAALSRLYSTIQRNEATNTANHMILECDSLEDRLTTLDRDDQIDRLLEDLKSRQPRLT